MGNIDNIKAKFKTKKDVIDLQRFLAANHYYTAPNLIGIESSQSNNNVKTLQKFLAKFNYLREDTDVDGKFGPKTIKALQNYLYDIKYFKDEKDIDSIFGERTQKGLNRIWGLTQIDGIFGNNTEAAINKFLQNPKELKAYANNVFFGKFNNAKQTATSATSATSKKTQSQTQSNDNNLLNNALKGVFLGAVLQHKQNVKKHNLIDRVTDLGKNWINRKISLLHTGEDDITEEDLSTRKNNDVVQKTKPELFAENYTFQERPLKGKNQLAGAKMTNISADLNTLRFGYRNFGDHTPVDKNQLLITAFEPFVSKEVLQKEMKAGKRNKGKSYIAIGTDGKFFVSKNLEELPDDAVVTNTFSYEVIDFKKNKDGSLATKQHKGNFRPVVFIKDKNGNVKEHTLNILTYGGKKGTNVYNNTAGGKIIMESEGDVRLESGSANDIAEAFTNFKEKHPNAKITFYVLDNGTYSRTFSFENGISSENIKKYQNFNTGRSGSFGFVTDTIPRPRITAPATGNVFQYGGFLQNVTLTPTYNFQYGETLTSPFNLFQNGGRLFQEGGENETVATNKTDLKPWKALSNIQYLSIPDTSFTRDKTGEGSIEYFSAEHPQGITYSNGYHVSHPSPGNDVILYNPNENDEQDIRLDALHIMPKDEVYDILNTVYRDAAINSDVSYNARKKYEDDVKKHGAENIDSYEQYFNNETDGLLRNMFIEGSPEYIESKRYYPDKEQLRAWNKHLLPYIDQIQTYLETGKRPYNVLPEVTITAERNKSNGGSIHIDPSKRGTFTAAATKHGMGVQEFASKVLSNKEDYSPAMVKKANFARNFGGRKHQNGGKVDYWNQKSMAEKAKLMKFYMRNGIIDLKEMRNHYNGYRLRQLEEEQSQQPITTSYGQWEYPGQVTKIPSNNITMKGVNYPVLGISNTGDTKLMQPNGEYHYNGNNVTEYPLYAEGGPVETKDPYQYFLSTIPENFRDYDSKTGLYYDKPDYNMRRYWELNGYPKDFDDAMNREEPLFVKENDGYHARSIARNRTTGDFEFMKSSNHPTHHMELDWYYSNDPSAVDFRNKYKYVPGIGIIPDQYIRRHDEGGHLFDKGGKTSNDKDDEEYTFVTPSWGNTGYVVPGTTPETSDNTRVATKVTPDQKRIANAIQYSEATGMPVQQVLDLQQTLSTAKPKNARFVDTDKLEAVDRMYNNRVAMEAAATASGRSFNHSYTPEEARMALAGMSTMAGGLMLPKALNTPILGPALETYFAYDAAKDLLTNNRTPSWGSFGQNLMNISMIYPFARTFNNASKMVAVNQKNLGITGTPEYDLTTLRRKLTQGQLTKILQEQGEVKPMSGENGALTFTNAHPRKAPYYIETDVPVETVLPGTDVRDFFNQKPFSTRYKADKDFSLNIYDDKVKVYKKGVNGYKLIDKETLFNTPELQFDVVNPKKDFGNTKDLKLSDHHIVLAEPPIQTFEGSTFYPRDLMFEDTKIPIEFENNSIIKDNFYGGVFDDINIDAATAAKVLRGKIANRKDPTWLADNLGIVAKKYYVNKYGVDEKAISDEEWAKLGQTILEQQRNKGNEVFYHSTYQPFSVVEKSELGKANQGYLGRGFYLSDVPEYSYGPVVLPFSMPIENQVVLSRGNNRLRADVREVDDFLSKIVKSKHRWTKEGFKKQPYGWWPGMSETSKDPEGWNNLIQKLDFDAVKSRVSSKGYGFNYPEILIPENKVDKLEMLFKHPLQMKNGGYLFRKIKK